MNARLLLHLLVLISLALTPSITPAVQVLAVAAEPSAGQPVALAACQARLNDNPMDYPSVQAAVDASANPSDIIKVAGTCTGVNNYGGTSQQVYLEKSLTIQGGYTATNWTDPDPIANPTILDATGLGRVMVITGSITATLEGLHLTGGYNAEPGICPPCTATGGGVAIMNATVAINHSWIYNNTVVGEGGGIDIGMGTLTLASTEVYSNTAAYDVVNDFGQGGALSSYGATVILIGNTFRGNTAEAEGGGIFLRQSIAEITANTFFSNTAYVDGGALNMYSCQATITGNVFDSNKSFTGSAGAVKTSDTSFGPTLINENHFTGNQANWVGAALFVNEKDDVVITGNSFIGNLGNEGSGITVNNSTGITLTNNIISDNTSYWRGGGLAVYDTQAQVSENAITGNNTDWSGGGIFITGGAIALTNNAVTGNLLNLGTLGSGIYISGTSPLLMHTTVANNEAPNGDFGAIYLTGDGSAVQLVNTILAYQGIGIAADTGASATLDGVLWYTNDLNHSGDVTVYNAYTGDPQFLADGYHIASASYAVDRGVNSGVNVDIDSVPRPLGAGYDFGADEYGDVPIAGLTAANDSPTALDQYTTLQAAVTAGTRVTYAWDFGDGVMGSGQVVQHKYATVGQFIATVTATNSVSSASASTTVIVDIPIAGLTAANNGPTPLGQPTTLSASITAGTNVSYSWDFGDGSTGNGATVQHTYPAEGTYIATVTASNSLGSQTASTVVSITFTDTPIVGLVASNDSPTYLGFPTTLNATVTSGTNVSYAWAFGDGTTGSGATVQHTYPAVGEFTAVVTATNPINSATASTAVTILPVSCLAKLNNEPALYLSVQEAVFASTSPQDVVKVTGHCLGVSSNLPSIQHVVIDRTLTLRGGYNPTFTEWDPELFPTVLDAQGLGKVVTISGGSPTLEYLNLTNGWSLANGDGAGIYVNSGVHPTLRHIKLYENHADHFGGAAFVLSGNFTIQDSEIYSNTAGFDGGGLYLRSVLATTEVKDSQIHHNHSGGQGGGLFAQYTTLVASGNAVYSNTADFEGDGIFITENASATITNNEIYANGGEGLRAENNTSLLIEANTIHDNALYSSAISLYGENNARLTGNQVYGNQPSPFGAIDISYSSEVELSHNRVQDNAGPGVSFYGSSAFVVAENEITGNASYGVYTVDSAGQILGNRIHANQAGGGYLVAASGASIEGNWIYANTLNGTGGGGLWITSSSPITLTNNVIAGNHAVGGSATAPGILIGQSEAYLRHNTFARNTGAGGQGLSSSDSSVWLVNTVIVSQTVGVEATSGSISLDATLWGAGAWDNAADWSAVGSGTIVTGTVNLWGDPAFKDPDSFNYRLLPESPAVDAGIAAGVTIDIEGDPRPDGPGYDLGADEAVPDLPLSGLTAANDGPTILGALTTLSAEITAGNHAAYTWDFGDGTVGSGQVAWHVYPAAGVYEATVTAQNDENLVTASTLVTIVESFLLPPGGGQGGTSNGLLEFEIPLAYPDGVVITYTPQLTPEGSPGNFSFAGITFHLEAVDANGDPVTSFSPPISLTLAYDESALPPGMLESDLELYRYDLTLLDWVPLPVLARDLEADSLTVLLDHFSEFALLAPGEVSVYLPTILRRP